MKNTPDTRCRSATLGIADIGPFKPYVTQMAVGTYTVIWISTNQHYEGVWYNVISVTRGWGVQFPEKVVCNT